MHREDTQSIGRILCRIVSIVRDLAGEEHAERTPCRWRRTNENNRPGRVGILLPTAGGVLLAAFNVVQT